jgi:hypothetical protein
LTQQELLGLHTKVKALQDQHGISYKDAAHRLYHAEVQKLSALSDAAAVFSNLHEGLDDAIEEAVDTEGAHRDG